MILKKTKSILCFIILSGVAACATPDPNSTMKNYEPPSNITIEDNRLESNMTYDDITINKTIPLPQNVSNSGKGVVNDFYISATGEMCWEVLDTNANLITMCENENGYKFTRNIISNRL